MGITELEYNVSPEYHVEIYEWCRTNFGPSSNGTWVLLSNNEIRGWIYFTSTIDAMAFKLRWAE